MLPDLDTMWDFDRPDASEAAFVRLLPAARAAGDRDYLGQLLTQIARAQGLQMRFEEAWSTLEEALKAIDSEPSVARIRLSLERGRVLNSSKRREESTSHFRSAWDLARALHADWLAVDAAHMLGIVEPGDASIEWNRTAIQAAEESSDPKARRWLGSLYNNLGWTYHERGEDLTALDLFQRALAAREAEGKKGPIEVARWCVARILRSIGRIDDALEAQRRLLQERPTDGYVCEEIGECLLALGRPEEARPHFAAAHAALQGDPWLARDEPERLERLRRLGGLESAGIPVPRST